MANYRIGDIVRLTRRAKGMSQQELAFQSGVATETISRIESGKHKTNQITYKKIMEALNRFSERSYAICSCEDLGIIEEKKLLEDAEAKYEYKEAEKYLEILRKKVDASPVNRQYIMRSEALLAYYNNKIDAETMLKQLEYAIRLTVYNYDKYMDGKSYKENGYPFTEQEILLLMNLAGAYGKLNLYGKEERILNILLDCLDCGYMEGEEVERYKLLIKRNLSRSLEGVEKYEDAKILLEEILEEAIRERYGLMIPIALYDITWNMEKINQVEGDNVYDLEEVRKKKRQAYYIAAARNDEHVKTIIKNSYIRLFGEEP